jgi:tRNA(adenine34) deaminase
VRRIGNRRDHEGDAHRPRDGLYALTLTFIREATMKWHRNCGPACSGNHVSALPSRRSILAGLVCAAVLPASTSVFTTAAAQSLAEDEKFMRMAIDEARQADFPFGAVIVGDGRVLARGRNLGRANDDPTAHAEMTAIRRCEADHGSASLRGSTIYASGEPCVMCMGAILWSHIGRLVYAASVDQLASRISQIMISSAEIASKAPFAPISITGGVLADEAMALFTK